MSDCAFVLVGNGVLGEVHGRVGAGRCAAEGDVGWGPHAAGGCWGLQWGRGECGAGDGGGGGGVAPCTTAHLCVRWWGGVSSSLKGNACCMEQDATRGVTTHA